MDKTSVICAVLIALHSLLDGKNKNHCMDQTTGTEYLNHPTPVSNAHPDVRAPPIT